MLNFNKCQLAGNIGKDPEIRTTAAGKRVAKFSLATTSGYGDKKITHWHNVVVFNETSVNFIENYLGKGRNVFIEGTISYRSWEDASGLTKYITEIIAYDVQAIDKGESAPAKQEVQPSLPMADVVPELDDDIPF